MLNRVLVSTDAVGGIWQYSLELARGFAASGLGVVLAAMGPAPDPAQCAEAEAMAGVRLAVTELPLDWLADSAGQLDRASERLAGLAERTGVDSVHLHTPALIGDVTWPAPVVAVAHSCVGTWWRTVRKGPLPPDMAWRADAVAQGLARADAVIAPTRSFADLLQRHYGTTRPIHAIHNGRGPLPRSFPPAVPRAIPGPPPFPPDATPALRRPRAGTVLTAGRLWDEGKNVACLDTAAALLGNPVLAAGPTAGPNGATIALPHLTLLGSLDEAALRREYVSAVVFVSMAHYEPFGLAVLEAAQAGCALVLSDIPTFRELWAGAALYLDPDQPEALADILGQLLRDPERCARLGSLAQARAARFGVERMVAATWNVHQALIHPECPPLARPHHAEQSAA